ncbi:MAG: type III-A CRISPR-associated protein Csm2 [Caldimicrobium sp.]|jgi:CRISPR-associated protein Csm2|nr:type III-A CRISPR-associated protein Csm2 [Caldimicrobium sp.]
MTQGSMRNDRRSPQGSGQRSTQQHNERPNSTEIKFWIDKEKRLVNPDLFSKIAYDWSEKISGWSDSGDINRQKQNKNRRSQIRKFYDEVLFFYDNLKNKPKENFKQFLPFIKMIRAKVYYSLGRKHIDNDFKEMIEKCLNQIEDWDDFEVFKNFFEAFMGYYRFHRPSD